MSKNREIAEIFENMADMLSITDENPFKIRAYKKAAVNILELREAIEDASARGELTEIPGVGKDLADKIREYVETGRMKEYERLQENIPLDTVELLRIPGLGPKTLSLLFKGLGIRNAADLEKALDGPEILKFKGMGLKKIEDIRRGIALLRESKERSRLGVVLPIGESLVEAVSRIPRTEGAILAGSLRRMRETVKDIDVLTISDNPPEVVEAFTSLRPEKDVLASGSTKGSVILQEGIQADLRVVGPESYGAALLYFTGSKAHNVRLRGLAQKKGLKINEYGVFRGEEMIAGETEREIYETLGLPFIPPELREDRGEIEAAMEGRLPDLIDLADIRGDLHTHTTWSDGKATIAQMADAAEGLGYEYIAITDHSPSQTIAKGLPIERLLEKKKELAEEAGKRKKIKVLMGTEVDIKMDGTLDYPDEILKDLDVVVASVHSGFKMDRETMTSRIISAIRNPYVHAIGHPTGRLINEREPYDVDIDLVIGAAAEYGKALEVNGSHPRLDLNDLHVRKAVDAGVKIIISTDAHSTAQLLFMRYGVGTARRGWVEKKDVLNALPFGELYEWLKSGRG
ncbi:MAG TPA: DNA polymerase/3'-5' exonuclease PolX [Thermodesulfobacteriota bacterium]|nr:DNA polymerase/3'-5' exonuclease PolX [Thermodesulfobacteriota bacterium]